MRSFPREVVEAARMDGASNWRSCGKYWCPTCAAPSPRWPS
ncbi:hypothetical protein [Devosia ginsengisoli]|nr:hypothetical protein [Devosia ginsengisoli]